MPGPVQLAAVAVGYRSAARARSSSSGGGLSHTPALHPEAVMHVLSPFLRSRARWPVSSSPLRPQLQVALATGRTASAVLTMVNWLRNTGLF